MEKSEEGWAFPGRSRKAHYMVDGMALCRAWGFYYGPLEQGNDASPDNCTACIKKLAERRAKGEVIGEAKTDRSKDN